MKHLFGKRGTPAILSGWLLVPLVLVLIALPVLGASDEPVEKTSACTRIVSLYTGHTETLFFLGADDQVIGVSPTDDFPPEVITRVQCDYRSDPEKILSLEPDCVLIRDFIARRYPDFVTTLERSGIPVINLNPETLDDLVPYFLELGALSGREAEARELVTRFEDTVDGYRHFSSILSPEQKKRFFFETIGDKYATTTPGSLTDQLFTVAGGVNVAGDAVATVEGSRIAEYGIERLLSRASEIDVYIAQQGHMNRVNLPAILLRPGFSHIKAVQDGNVHILRESILSRPSPRLLWGLEELARLLYPEQFDELSHWETGDPISRSDFAEMLVRSAALRVFIPERTDYSRPDAIPYGNLADLPWTHPQSRYVETLLHHQVIDIEEKGPPLFHPAEPITLLEAIRWLATLYPFPEPTDWEVPPTGLDHLSANDQHKVLSAIEAGLIDANSPLDLHHVLSGLEAVQILQRLSNNEIN